MTRSSCQNFKIPDSRAFLQLVKIADIKAFLQIISGHKFLDRNPGDVRKFPTYGNPTLDLVFLHFI